MADVRFELTKQLMTSHPECDSFDHSDNLPLKKIRNHS